MRCTFDFLPDEEQAVVRDVETIKKNHPGIKVRKGKDGATFKHLYLTTRNHGKPRAARETES